MRSVNFNAKQHVLIAPKVIASVAKYSQWYSQNWKKNEQIFMSNSVYLLHKGEAFQNN